MDVEGSGPPVADIYKQATGDDGECQERANTDGSHEVLPIEENRDQAKSEETQRHGPRDHTGVDRISSSGGPSLPILRLFYLATSGTIFP